MSQQNYQPTAECNRFDAELMTYLEGESRPFVASHVRECVFCAVVLADLEQVRFSARQLPLLEPSPAVWANLRAGLDREGFFRSQSRGWDWLGILHALANPAPAGALACAAILGVLLTASPQSLEQRQLRASAPPTDQNTPSVPTTLTADNELASMIQNLEVTYRANEKFLAPEVRATYEKGLNSLDTSIKECKDSLQKEPDNTLAHDYLLTAYTQKAEVLASALEFQGR